jgi:DNA-directed RNA polymerase specialized sigma24 family protein
MGRESTQQATPDLFSTDTARDVSAAPTERSSSGAAPVPIPSQRHVLPENLDHAVKQLADDEVVLLLEVVLKEANQRGKSLEHANGKLSPQSERARQKHRPIEKASSRKQVEVAEVTLSPGKRNAVRAAFKAGVTPARIARQFGISQTNVRKALDTTR